MLECKSNQMRQLLMEASNVKLKDSLSSGKMDVHIFLFTDLLLICKKSSVGKKSSHVDKVKVIRPPFLVDRLVPVSNQSNESGSSHVTSSSHHHKDSSAGSNQLALIYINEFRVMSSIFILYTPDAKGWLEQIRKAQTKYSEAKQRASHLVIHHPSSSTPFIYRSLTTDDDDESLLLDQTHQILLLTSGYSPRSSRSSLFHSHSGSVEMASEGPSIMGSNMMLTVPPTAAPPQTPTLPNSQYSHQHLLSADLTAGSSSQPSRARSFELGELRNPSLSVDAEAFVRSQSMETRGPVVTTLTTKTLTSTTSSSSSFCGSSTRINVKPPPPKIPPRKGLTGGLQRCISPVKKPPLLKTKNVEPPPPLHSSPSLQSSSSSSAPSFHHHGTTSHSPHHQQQRWGRPFKCLEIILNLPHEGRWWQTR